MKRISIIILCIAMALMFATVSPLQLAAGSKEKYISELKLAYGTDERDELVADGYTAVKDNLNSGNSVEVYLCYKTTSNKDEAIYDISMMNMDGNYSSAKFEEMVKQKKDNIAVTIDGLMTAISEFKTNYDAGTYPAKIAYKFLDMMTDDDTGKTLGELFFGDVTREQLETIILQSNTKLLGNIYYAISLGCSYNVTGGTLLDALKAENVENEYDEMLYSACQAIKVQYETISELMLYFNNTWNAAAKTAISYGRITSVSEMTETLFTSYLTANEAEYSENYESLMLAYAIYTATKEVEYAHSGKSVYEFLIQNPDELTEEDFAPFAHAMTDGQYGIMSNVGLFTELAQAAYSDGDLDNAFDKFKATVEAEGFTSVSIYLGVDRTIYGDDVDVAMTTDAATEAYANENYEWVTTGATIYSVAKKVHIIAGAAMILLCTIFVISFIKALYFDVVLESGGYSLGNFLTGIFSWNNSYFLTFKSMDGYMVYVENVFMTFKTFVIMLVALAIICIGAVLVKKFLGQATAQKEFVDYTYTDIPDIIIDFVEDDSLQGEYVYYYAVTKADGTPADLNGWDNKTNKYWNALYVSYDSRLGQPITEGFFASTSDTAPKNMTGVHDFAKGVEGVKSAANLNTSSKAQDTKIYLYYETYSESTMTASAFSAGIGMACTFVLGAAITIIVQRIYKNRKKEETV